MIINDTFKFSRDLAVEEIQEMKKLMELSNSIDNTQPSNNFDNIISDLKIFMEKLTLPDKHTFSRDVRRMMDDLIEVEDNKGNTLNHNFILNQSLLG